MKKFTLYPLAVLSSIVLFSGNNPPEKIIEGVLPAYPIRTSSCMGLKNTDLINLVDTSKTGPPLFTGLGNYHFKVSTKNQLAQKYFNQGLALYYGFNHAEAYRSFYEASKLDPECAMAFWGQALSLGPNINAPMDQADATIVFAAVQKAGFLSAKVSERERDYINALAKRYIPNPPQDRFELDQAYSLAMKILANKYPDDLDAATLYAESIMDLHPWDFWLKDGTARPWTAEILDQLEKVMKVNKDHAGANHFYIHAVEASQNANRAEASADRLRTLLPGAGHLVHMPAHIYIRTGQYHKGTISNEASIKADQLYLNECNSKGLYGLIYHPHNYHFLWACTTLEGRGDYAIKAADSLSSKFKSEMMLSPFGFTVQHLYVTPVFAKVRFGKWDKLIEMESMDKKYVYANAMIHYGRGVAFAKKGMTGKALAEKAELEKLMSDTTLRNISVGALNSPYAIMAVADKVLDAEIASAKKNYTAAVNLLKEGVKLEDELNYTEPADWHHPVRQVLGALLLKTGKAAEAEKFYREDLKVYPENGWSLYGLHQALVAQNKEEESKVVKSRYDKVFVLADAKLTSSTF
ncbi:hypothetical protein [Daejeonella oryzae]|uniref:hypothetical protein n=1 Tax=Daejeonella oryzae TaxID=1122943 RepID=UPI0004056C6F|nr:hypothetical protein [Daejeonella oryzae]